MGLKEKDTLKHNKCILKIYSPSFQDLISVNFTFSGHLKRKFVNHTIENSALSFIRSDVASL